MPDAIDPAARIEKLLDKAEPRLARAFRAAVARLRGDLDLKVLAGLLASGNFDEALIYTQQVAEDLGAEVNLVFFNAGQDTTRFLNGLDVGHIVFDQVNVRAVRALQANTLRLVTQYTEEQRAATRLALLDGISRGLNPRDQARNFRDSIGLTERQQAAVVNYRRLLGGTAAEQTEALSRELRDRRFDPTVKRSRRTQVPLTPAQIDKMVSRYADRYVKHRAEVIARTEALRSVHEGVEEAYEQAIDSGNLRAEDLVRTWDSSRDGRVRRTHGFLHGQKRGWRQFWATENGVLRYPGDPLAPAEETIQCRCLLTTRIKNALRSLRKYAVPLSKGVEWRDGGLILGPRG